MEDLSAMNAAAVCWGWMNLSARNAVNRRLGIEESVVMNARTCLLGMVSAKNAVICPLGIEDLSL